MTLRYVDGFDYMPAGTTNTDRLLEASGYYLRGYPSFFGTAVDAPNNVTTGRFSFGGCLSYSLGIGSQANLLRLVRPFQPGGSYVTGFMGLALKIGKTSVCPTYISFYDAIDDAPQFSVEWGVNGVVRAYRGSPGGTLLGTSGAGAFYYDQWFYAEVGGTIDSVAGYVEVRINTAPVLIVPSINTKATSHTSFDSFQLGARAIGLSSPFVAAFDDLYFNDDAGSVNNTFLGNVRVKTQFTAGAGSSTQFAIHGAAATNWQAVLNKVLDDSGYVFDATIGDKDLYTIQAILTSAGVHGAQVRIGARQDDATQRTLRNLLRMGGTTAEGADHLLNQTYTYYTDIFETDPSTGTGITGTAMNAAEIGPKVQA
jgi:hypothetical protein